MIELPMIRNKCRCERILFLFLFSFFIQFIERSGQHIAWRRIGMHQNLNSTKVSKEWCEVRVIIAKCLLGRRVLALSATLNVWAIGWTRTKIFLNLLWYDSNHSSQKEWSVCPAPLCTSFIVLYQS